MEIGLRSCRARDGEGVAERPVVHRPSGLWTSSRPPGRRPPGRRRPSASGPSEGRTTRRTVRFYQRSRRKTQTTTPKRKTPRLGRRSSSEVAPSTWHLEKVPIWCTAVPAPKPGLGPSKMRREDRHGARELGNAAAGRFGYRATAYEAGASGELNHAAVSVLGSAAPGGSTSAGRRRKMSALAAGRSRQSVFTAPLVGGRVPDHRARQRRRRSSPARVTLSAETHRIRPRGGHEALSDVEPSHVTAAARPIAEASAHCSSPRRRSIARFPNSDRGAPGRDGLRRLHARVREITDPSEPPKKFTLQTRVTSRGETAVILFRVDCAERIMPPPSSAQARSVALRSRSRAAADLDQLLSQRAQADARRAHAAGPAPVCRRSPRRHAARHPPSHPPPTRRRLELRTQQP